MRRVILQEFLTLDGMAAEADGGTDFIPGSNRGDQSLMEAQLKMLSDIDTMVLGRVTYEMFADYWPTATEGEDKELAKIIGGLDKFIFSKTLESAPWGDMKPGTVISGDAAEELPKVKGKPGKDIIIWGSISLVQDLINERLIDEYRLVTCPVVLGSGRAFFDETIDSTRLRLAGTTNFDRGSVELRYEPAEAASSRGAN